MLAEALTHKHLYGSFADGQKRADNGSLLYPRNLPLTVRPNDIEEKKELWRCFESSLSKEEDGADKLHLVGLDEQARHLLEEHQEGEWDEQKEEGAKQHFART